MIMQLFKKQKDLSFERSYPSSIATVWRAWTEPEMLREWWGPDKTTVRECEIDPQVGGRIYVVMEAGEEMGKYAGTRWPMEGIFTRVEKHTRLVWDARSWTEGDEEGSTIHHTNDLSLSEHDGITSVNLRVAITQIGPKARMAAFGMKWGYEQQLDHLGDRLAEGF